LSLGNLLLRVPALLIAIIVHEYAHARTADALGDPTPRATGRLTLNPLAHLDPIGLLMLWIFQFGWARPVQINPFYFQDRRRGVFLVSLAGPVSNMVMALLVVILLRLGLFPFGSTGWTILNLTALYNVLLSVFNLIPIPPLDGSKVLMSILPTRQALSFQQLEPYGWVILLVAIYTGVVGAIMWPMVRGLLTVIERLAGLVVPF